MLDLYVSPWHLWSQQTRPATVRLSDKDGQIEWTKKRTKIREEIVTVGERREPPEGAEEAQEMVMVLLSIVIGSVARLN